MVETDDADAGSGEDARSRSGSMVRLSIALVVGGVLAMVLPGLLRDGVCGLVACADVTPDVAVGMPTGSELAVVIPPEAAEELRSLRLYPVDADPTEPAGNWIVFRTDSDSAPTTVALGEQPEGFDTRIELLEQPESGFWAVEASFGCASTLVGFAPDELTPGFVTSGEDPVPVGEFDESARSDLRCATQAPTWQRVLFILGALAASAGAVLGIVLVFRRPVNDDDWYDDDSDEFV